MRLLVAVAVLLMLSAGCLTRDSSKPGSEESGEDADPSGDASDVAMDGGGSAALRFDLVLVGSSFQRGEEIPIQVALTNDGDVPARVRYSTSNFFQLAITDSTGRTVVEWPSSCATFAEGEVVLDIAPGEAKALGAYSWNQTVQTGSAEECAANANHGGAAPTGDYAVEATCLARDHDGDHTVTASRSFTIS